MHVTEYMKVVSWCNEYNAQINSIIDYMDTYNNTNIVVMKHNDARTGPKQGADLTRVF